MAPTIEEISIAIRSRLDAIATERRELEWARDALDAPKLASEPNKDPLPPGRQRRSPRERIPVARRAAILSDYLRTHSGPHPIVEIASALGFPRSSAQYAAEVAAENGQVRTVKTTRGGGPKVVEYRPTRVRPGSGEVVRG